jgi:tetratricopeptide (TPR) repeat protein
MRRFAYSLFYLLAFSLTAQESEPALPLKYVDPQLREVSLFTDRVATLRIEFDTMVEAPEDWPERSDSYQILNVEVQATEGIEPAGSVAIVQFLPSKTGALTLPGFDFQSATTAYQTKPIQLLVSEPIRSDEMSLTLKPQKLKVYAGEPLQIDLTWRGSLNAAALKNLRLFPDFFNDPAIEIVIPRTTAAEDRQIGMPIGGRRVIATRTLLDGNNTALGAIDLTLFLRFATPGSYTLPATRLECALLDKPDQSFARYAAYFNNAFFEPVSPSEGYARIYTIAAPVEIEVLPLPVDETPQPFTGLFEPLTIEVSANPTELEIGQLMELELKVSSHAPHGMIELPPLTQQPGLRERFLIDPNYGRLWHPEGTVFRTRIRPLSTSTKAIPSLHFKTFNPESGQFEIHQTEPIPLTLRPSNGQTYIPLNTFEGATVPLTHQPQGIWQNLEVHPMNDTLNSITHLLDHFFWPLICLGPIAFIAILPIVRERRRRALHPDYAQRVQAYKTFRKLPETSPQRWPAFLKFMGTTFRSKGEAWTRGDSVAALKKIDLDGEAIEALVQMHKAVDAGEYSHQTSHPEFKTLGPIAKKIARITSKTMLLLCLLSLSLSPNAEANQWTEAEQSFAQAQAAPVGSDAAMADYKIAALKFEDLAVTRQHGGEAWVNAGNAWFQAGEVGRAIAAYRNAQAARPFDPKLDQNLSAARAMVLNEVPDQRNWLEKIPTRWIQVTTLMINLIFWLSLLVLFRYSKSPQLIASCALGILLLVITIILTARQSTEKTEGTVIVDSVYAKKGPGYAYANAFNEALYDGIEFAVLETREGWIRIQLVDKRESWIPQGAAQLLQTD